jgi:acyl-CoA thioester hydrolase
VSHRHVLEVRYGECDQQGVVFNAHYLAYVDDAMDQWMHSVAGSDWVAGWDVMLKRATVVWHAPARWRDELVIDSGVTRWGRTSFDVVHQLSVCGVAVADVLITYVSISADDLQPSPPPARVVEALGAPVPVPDSLG